VAVLALLEKRFAETNQVSDLVDLIFCVVGNFEPVNQPKVGFGVDLQH
jgi:hypothetical protein